MKLFTSPSLLSAIVLRGLFIAAANHRKIDKPETLGRSHSRVAAQPHSSPWWGWKADYCAIGSTTCAHTEPICAVRSPGGLARC